MDFQKEHIIEDLYSSGIFAEVETSPEYKKLIREYNELYETIEDTELKAKFTKLEELKNKMNGETDKTIFKLGFSLATKMIIEAMSCNLKWKDTKQWNKAILEIYKYNKLLKD